MRTAPDWYTRSLRCGCYHCIKTFDKNEIEDWVDDGQTALCPYCGIDSVVGDDGNDIDTKALKADSARFGLDAKENID